MTGTASHSWSYSGAFIIKAKAVDEHGSESEWSYHTVTIPKNKAKSSFYSFLNKLMNHFPNFKIFFSEVFLK